MALGHEGLNNRENCITHTVISKMNWLRTHKSRKSQRKEREFAEKRQLASSMYSI